tara:strand:- start:1558 stop:4656 length:3099 start_codon:yes stop_codon:yes gene_type:complete
MGTTASNFLLDEQKYVGIVEGWNEKLSSSSLKLSELTPFIEVYAVFKENDIIYKNPNVASEISQRLVDIKVKQNNETPVKDLKIAPICSSNKSQLENDSLGIVGPSYRGQPGINDFTVARGAAASLNVKYDLSITIPNPEIFNELFEYSRLISTNSTFLIIHGWNVPPSFNSTAPPPKILSRTENNVLNLKIGGNGFYEAALVNVYKFDFSFDNVGHLTGKVSFLPEMGSFLVGTRTDSISKGVLKQLIEHDNNAPVPGDTEVTFSFNDVPYTHTFSTAINPERDPIGSLDGRIVGNAQANTNNAELNRFIATEAYRAALDLTGNFSLPTDGTPFLTQVTEGSVEQTELIVETFLETTMPRYGKILMNNFKGKLQGLYGGSANPNYNQSGLFVGLQLRGDTRLEGTADQQTVNLRERTSVISVPLVTIIPDGREPSEDQRGLTVLNRTDVDSDTGKITIKDTQTGDVEIEVTRAVGEIIESKVFLQTQPVYFFLGAILEAISKMTKLPEKDIPEVNFLYDNLNTETDDPYIIPIPQPTREQFDGNKEELNKTIQRVEGEIKQLREKLENESFFDESGSNPLSDEIPEGAEISPMDEAIQKAEQDIKDLGRELAISSSQIDSLDEIAAAFINGYKKFEIKNVFDIPVDISRAKAALSNGNAPMHSLIKQIIDIANETNPTLKLATRPYNKDSRYIEVYVANMPVKGVSQDVFGSIKLEEYGDLTVSVEEKVRRANQSLSQKTVVCEFGTERSLVENFSLNAKVDATAFASFRLPAVVGGRSVDLSKLIYSQVNNEAPDNIRNDFIGDVKSLIERGFTSNKKELEELKIITTNPQTGQIINVNEQNLENFLKLSGGPNASVAGRQVVVRLIDELRAVDSNFSNSIIAKQNQMLMMGSDVNPSRNQPAFFGGVLSNFLRKITLTIHGTVGLSTFNLIYVKGLMRGIEGIYQITSVTESLTPANFTTTLECTLVNYKDNNPDSNPFAETQGVSIRELSETGIGSVNVTEDAYQQLIRDTETRLQQATDSSNIKWDG